MFNKLNTLIKVKVTNLPLVFAICITSILLIVALVTKPELTGDGQEYYLMLESFYNHQSADLRPEDIYSFEKLYVEYGFKHYQFVPEAAYGGYFDSTTGSSYSYHFWGYSLINLPVKVILEALDINPLKVFQITNALLVGFMLVAITRLKNISKNKIFLLQLISVFNPVFWFIFWSHPEVFSYSFVILSLVYLFNKRINLAIALSAIASIQNPPLLVIPLALFTYNLYSHFKTFKVLGEINIKDFTHSIVALAITAIPFAFYYLNFGVFNLISSAGGSDFKLISLQRIFELLFDLNIGAMTYAPILFLTSIGAGIILFIKSSKRIKMILLCATILLIFVLALSSSTTNWNHGTTGPSRYTLWSVFPFVFFIFYLALTSLKISQGIFKLTLVSVLINIIILFSVFLPNVSFGATSHSYLSNLVLDNFPKIYNPSPEIFAERSLGTEFIDYSSLYVSYDKCKKILINASEIDKIALNCPDVEINYCTDEYCYFSE